MRHKAGLLAVLLSMSVQPRPLLALPAPLAVLSPSSQSGVLLPRPSISPSTIPVDWPTVMTAAIRIRNQSADVQSLTLERLDAKGRNFFIVGPLRDDGLNGDAVPGDGKFTLQFTMNEPALGTVRLRVAAVLRPKMRKAYSDVVVVRVVPQQDGDGDGFTPGQGDCDDTDRTIHPGAAEACNGSDDDCDGSVDEGFALGVACSVGVGACSRGGMEVCAPGGNGTVCDAVPGSPSAELCNSVDDDCDGSADNGFDPGQACGAGVGACWRAGVKVCAPDGSSTVCDASPGPPAAELCNGTDDNCDGSTDEGFDAGAVCGAGVGACWRGGAKVCSGDGSGTVCDAAPGAPVAEVCNGLDDNCDGSTDEGVTLTYYEDADADGFGVEGDTTQACDATPGYAAAAGDCDDANSSIHPGATEIADNGIDEDCSGGDLITNRAPFITSDPVTEATADFGYGYQVTALDPEDAALTFALLVAPARMAIDPRAGLITWTPALVQLGDQDVVVEVRDPLGATGTQAYVVSVLRLNLSPIITSVPVGAVRSGDEYRYDVEAFEPEGEAVTYEFAADPPSGMTIDPQSGLIAWISGAAGEYPVSVRARDPSTGADVQNYVLKVFDEPLELFSPAGAFEVLVGDTLTLPLLANYANAGFSVDPLPNNAAINGNAFTFTPTADQRGVHTMAFQARYADMRAGNLVVVGVARRNTPPEIMPIGAKTVDEGKQLTFVIEASDADGDALTFSAPGLTLENAFFNEMTHQFTFAPSLEQAGTHQVMFAVSDGQAAAQAAATIEVADVAPPTPIDLVIDPVNNPTFQTKQTISGSVTGQLGPPPAPEALAFITSLTPASVRPGRSAVIEMTGYNTHFAQETSTANFGDGITVESFEVLSPASARAAIRADQQAEPGTRSVRVAEGGREVYSIVAFTVEKGAATISGVVQDPFIQQPLANARVSINGTDLWTQTDDQGRFTLDGVLPGSTMLLVTLPNYEVKKFDLAIAVNQTFNFDEPIPLNALARPASPGGTLPRAATVASVIDRDVGDMTGTGLNLEQAKMVVADTIIAVGGTELGVLDEAGNQLNPKIEGADALSLTPLGVERHAKALMQGDVYTLKEFVWTLQQIFNFSTPLTVQTVLTGFQEAVNQAWANPTDPRWSMAIVLFNEGTTLSSSAPILTPDTRINRFQAFLLFTSFIFENLPALETTAERALEANGVDWRLSLPPQPLQSSATSTQRVAALDLGERFSAAGRGPDLLIASQAHALQANPAQEETTVAGDLMARKTFTNMWRLTTANVLFESAWAGMEMFRTAFAMHMAIGYMIGSVGGLAGAVTGLSVAVVMSMSGFVNVAIYKVVLSWFVALTAASFEPQKPIVVESQLDRWGNFVITIERSESEKQTRTGTGPSLFKAEEIGYTYQLYSFPNCTEEDHRNGEWMNLPAELVLSDPRNQQDPPLGKLKFVIPRTRLEQGANYFRVVTFQYVHNANKKVIEGASDYDTDDDHLLTWSEVEKQRLAETIEDFLEIDVNGDGLLDDDEFKRQPVQENIVAESLGRDSDDDALPFTRTLSLSAGSYALKLNEEREDIQARQVAEMEAARERVLMQRTQARLRVLEQELHDLNTQRNQVERSLQQYASEANRVEKMVGVAKEYRYATTDPETFRAEVRNDEVWKVLEEPDRNAVYRIAELEDHVFYADQESKRTSNNVENLKALRNKIETMPIPDGESRVIGAEYWTVENGQRVRRDALVEVRADTRAEALAQVDPLLEAQRQEYISFTRERRLAQAEQGRLVRDLYSASGLPEAESNAQATSERLTTRHQAAIQKHRELNSELKRLKARQKLRTRSGSGLPAELEAPSYTGAGVALDVLGAPLGSIGAIGEFLSAVQTISSDPGACVPYQHGGVPLPTEEFPPAIVAHPDQEEVGAALRAAIDPDNRKGGFIERQYPLSEETASASEAGFPPAFLTTDVRGRIYADNRNSNVPYSGRLFRFTPTRPPGGTGSTDEPVPFTMTREFVGTINYYSLFIQMGRPAYPVAMAAGPKFEATDETGATVEVQDLFVADIDVMDGFKRILRVPVSLTDTRPTTFSEASGNRIHIVGQPHAESEQFWFTGPSDMEVGPDPASAIPTLTANSVIMLSDEDSIYAIFPEPGSGVVRVQRVIQIPARRWSGLAFDRAGKFYFADYVGGEVFVMTWDRLQELITLSFVLTNDIALKANAFVMAHDLWWPGDIEIEQGSSAHPGRALFISTFEGVDKYPLPIVGRLLHSVKELKIKRVAKEDDVLVFSDGLSFLAEPSYDDLEAREARLRARVADPETGADKWVERLVILAEHGATVLENWTP